MIRRLSHAFLSLSMLAGTGALVTATAGMAAAIGAPVMIDDFSGTHGGTRTVTLLPRTGGVDHGTRHLRARRAAWRR